MSEPSVVDVAEVVERAPVGRFQLEAFTVLGACLVMDGFDVQALGYAAPAIIEAWGIPKTDLAPVFGAGLLGLFLGSLVGGALADRVGRRPVLLAATALFGGFTVLTAAAGSVQGLLALRFLAGLGLGAIMPNATALVGEFSATRRRVVTIMVVTNGFLVGAVAAGLLAAWLVPAHGWRALFLVGGAVPLLLLGPMAMRLPESLQLLAVRGAHPERLARWLGRVDPAAPAGPGVRYTASEVPGAERSLPDLLRGGRAPATALLWAVNFLNVLNAYFVSSWLPTLLREAGRETSAAVLVGTATQVGGAIGTVALGVVLQRAAFVPVLAGCFLVAGASLALLGQPGLPLWALALVACVAGWGIFGGQPGLNALAATYYPTELRSTGLGAALGVGRLGAVMGPLLAGALLLHQWSTRDLFRAAALPALASAALIFTMRWVLPRPGTRARVAGVALLLGAGVLSGCLTVTSPRLGRPVEVKAGQALVFGRIRVTSPGFSRDLPVFSRDPLDHAIPPDPVLNLELRELRPPGGAVRYRSNPSPGIEGDGSFHWVLTEGEYALASNPRPYGSSRFDPAETTVLARFTVPRGPGTVYVGALEVVVEFEQSDFLEGWKGRETTYTIRRILVADEGEAAYTALLGRFPAVPEPRTTLPMVPEPP